METQANKQVVVAEDDRNDAFFLQHAFQEAKIPNPCVVLRDGQEAMDHLLVLEWARACCLVVTDLKMPRVNGFELLGWLRAQEHLRGLPAVVLTASADEEDRRRALALGARDLFVKPTDLPGLVRVAYCMWERWLQQPCPA